MRNLLLVSGTGRNSGKTTMVCRVIQQFRDFGIISVKISPHFHDPSEGLIPLYVNQGFIIYEETNRSTSKDTSRMLRCGASRVFFAQVSEDYLGKAFNELRKWIHANNPVVCESPSLIKYVDPGVFVIMISGTGINSKDIEEMRLLPHLEYDLKKLSDTASLPFGFDTGGWTNKPVKNY